MQQVASDAAVQRFAVAQVDLAGLIHGDPGVQVADAGILLLHATPSCRTSRIH